MADSLRVGGIQSSLKVFVNKLAESGLQVDLFLFNNDNYKKFIDEKINVITGGKLLKIISYTGNEAYHKGKFIYIIRKILAFLCKVLGSNFVYGIIFSLEKKLNRQYDYAISYSNNVSFRSTYFGCNKYVLEMVNALKKIGYIHLDYNLIYNKKVNSEYSKFDNIWFVSNYVKQTYLKYNLGFEKKCKVIYNFINDKNMVCNENPYHNKKFHIVTVGRLDDNKNQIDAVPIAKKLKEKFGDQFEWYLVGDGPTKNKLLDEIKKNKLENNLIITGYKNNIADYYYHSDVLVSLSKSESYGLAIVEALYCNLPVVIKKIPVSKELINNNGVVCDTLKEIYEEIKLLISDNKYYQKRKKSSILKVNNEDILKKIIEELR